MLSFSPIELTAKSCSRTPVQSSQKTFAAPALLAIFAYLSIFLFLEQPAVASAQTLGGIQVAAYPLPPLSIQHLRTLTDATGIHEFAHGAIPWHENGYCAEDAGRALVAITLYEQVTGRTDGRPLARVYLAYLQNSLRGDGELWNREGRTIASGDSYGRIIWGLGYAASFHPDQTIRESTARLFERILPGWEKKLGDYPIARAYAMQGLAAFLNRHPNPDARATLLHCAEMNLLAFRKHSDQKWKWFDETVTYDSGRLPLSLLLAFQTTGDSRFRDAGLASLDFLVAHVLTRRAHNSRWWATRAGSRKEKLRRVSISNPLTQRQWSKSVCWLRASLEKQSIHSAPALPSSGFWATTQNRRSCTTPDPAAVEMVLRQAAPIKTREVNLQLCMLSP